MPKCQMSNIGLWLSLYGKPEGDYIYMVWV